jgi:transcriptional regulator with XRE-family HTH domain
LKRGTQKKLAEKIGLTDQAVSMILSGNRGVSWENAKLISEVTGSPVDIWMDQDLKKMAEALSEWNPE